MSESQLQTNAADWRAALAKNNRKTRQVIFLFFCIYALVGILVDCVIYSSFYPLPLSAILNALFHLQLFPYATVSMAVVAFIAIGITFAFYDRIMLMGTEYHEVTAENAKNIEERQLFNVVEEMQVAAGLQFMPRVFIIDAPYMNAFASGYSEKSAMVAITRGLMEKLTRAELQAVMAHELSHIRHQDIKLTLTVGVLTNIMLMAVDLLFYNVVFSGRGRDREEADRNNRLLLIIIVLRYVLPVLTVLLTLYLSRTREYMADAGCVELMRDNQPLATALLKIEHDYNENKTEYAQFYGETAHEDLRRAAYLYDPVENGIEPVHNISSAFSTHPSTTDRLKAIGVQIKDS